MSFTFDYDSDKAKRNLLKHGIDFEEAKTVFYDDYARIKADPEHSVNENRFIILGFSLKNRLLVISFTERENVIRIINARKPTKKERIKYEEYL